MKVNLGSLWIATHLVRISNLFGTFHHLNAASFSARRAIFSIILDLRPNFRWWKYAPPFLVDFLYTTGPIFRLKPSQKGTVSVSNCSGATPIAPCSDDQHMQLWARARRELTWLRHGLRLTSRSAGRSLCEHFPQIGRFTCMHHTSLSMSTISACIDRYDTYLSLYGSIEKLPIIVPSLLLSS